MWGDLLTAALTYDFDLSAAQDKWLEVSWFNLKLINQIIEIRYREIIKRLN